MGRRHGKPRGASSISQLLHDEGLLGGDGPLPQDFKGVLPVQVPSLTELHMVPTYLRGSEVETTSSSHIRGRGCPLSLRVVSLWSVCLCVCGVCR